MKVDNTGLILCMAFCLTLPSSADGLKRADELAQRSDDGLTRAKAFVAIFPNTSSAPMALHCARQIADSSQVMILSLLSQVVHHEGKRDLKQLDCGATAPLTKNNSLVETPKHNLTHRVSISTTTSGHEQGAQGGQRRCSCFSACRS